MMPSMSRGAYVETIGSLLLRLRGSGLTLSPLDADRIRSWYDRRIPVDLACEAVQMAHDAWLTSGRHAGRRPFPLHRAEALIESLGERRARRLLSAEQRLAPEGAPQATPAEDATASRSTERNPVAELLSTLRQREQHSSGALRKAYEAAHRKLSASIGPLDERLLAADWAQVVGYLLALPKPERAAWIRSARAQSGPGARNRGSFRAILADEIHRHASLSRPSDLFA